MAPTGVDTRLPVERSVLYPAPPAAPVQEGSCRGYSDRGVACCRTARVGPPGFAVERSGSYRGKASALWGEVRNDAALRPAGKGQRLVGGCIVHVTNVGLAAVVLRHDMSAPRVTRSQLPYAVSLPADEPTQPSTCALRGLEWELNAD